MQAIEVPVYNDEFKAAPHEFYDRLRTTHPDLVPVLLPPGIPAWLAIGFDTAKALLADRRFSKNSVFAGPEWHRHQPNKVNQRSSPVFQHMLTLDPPEHSRLRELVQKHFTRPELEALRPTIEARVDHLVQSLIDREEVEFVSEFAVPLALGVLCGLLGVPAADEIRFRRWTDILVSSTVEDQKLIPSAAEELRSYFIQLDRSSLPAGSVLETLSQARLAGRINDEELAAMSFLLLVAGHETTVNLLSSGLLSIISSESLWSELANGSFQIRPFVNELLRFESPLEMATPRFAMEDVRLGNIRIRAGDTVFVGVAAANRDPRRFAIPHEIHDRVNARMHIGFGHGVHFCLGAPLAILEAESALLCLTRRVSQPSLAVDASTLKWRLGPIMRGLRSLPLRVSPI